MNKGLELGHEKAKQAGDNAGEEWRREAYSAFVKFAKANKSFTTEQVRHHFVNLDVPPDARAWGIIALQAKKNKVVKAIGLTRSIDRSKHGIPVTLWQSLVEVKR